MKTAKYHFMLAWLVCCWAGIAGQILSRNRSVYMSSQWSDWSGNRVVDGNDRTVAERCRCCAATTTQTDPWITIDLGNTYMITRICVYGRTDITGQNLDNLVFKLDGTSFTPTTDSTPTLSYTFILDRPTAAQNVTLMLPGSNRLLALCEFDVFNDNVISTNKFINASSEINTDWPIKGAVDGNNTTDGNACHCCAATKQENNPSLRVDLGGYFFITYIIIYGRTDDNHTDQLFNGLQIETGNGNIIDVPNTDNYYDSGAMRLGPVTYVKLQLNGNSKYLVVCELQVFGECADGYTETDSSCQTVCPAGSYGTNCSNKCGHCRNEAICYHTDGVCQQCDDGFNEVDKTCNTRCLGGTYGYNCTETCGACRDGLACNTTNGVCERCEDGLDETDITCKTLCANSTYGNNCTGVCGHCRNGTICNKTNGVCDQCEDGYMETDMLCVEPCEDFSYGHNCTGVCGHCKNGAICNKTNGVCDQCKDGYMETDMMCVERAENVSRPLTSCPTCLACPESPDIMMIVGVTVAAMLAIEGAAVVVTYLIRKRNSLRKDNVGEPSPYELPDRSINEDEHQYDSAMDMNVETPNYVNAGRKAI